MKDLGQLVDQRNAGFSNRFSKVLLDQLMHEGDPVADEASELDDEDTAREASFQHLSRGVVARFSARFRTNSGR